MQPFAVEPINPYVVEMKATARKLLAPSKSVLDTSEATEELAARLRRAGLAGKEADCKAWRELLYSFEGLGKYCSGVVLHEDAMSQSVSERPVVDVLGEEGVVVGVRVDTGFYPLNGYGEKGTDGHVGLKERCEDFYERGARFALWRSRIECGMENPSDVAVWENTTRIAESARTCQAEGLMFAAEVDVVPGQDAHSIERSAYVSEKVWSNVMRFFNEHEANLESALLLSRPCLPGSLTAPARPEDVAEYTARTLRRTAPPALGGVLLVLVGDKPDEAARNLCSVQEAAVGDPWRVSPMYGPELLLSVLGAWAAAGGSEGGEEAVAAGHASMQTALEASATVQFVEEAAE